jgi:membrane protease YdiL (CAAX protease family)
VNQSIKKASLFVGLTFCVNWLMAGLFYAVGGRWNTVAGLMMGAGYMFVPMIIAIVVQKSIYKEPAAEPLGISFGLNRWFLVAWLLPPVVAFGALAVSLLLPGVEYSSDIMAWLERFRPLIPPEQFEQMQSQAEALPVHPIWIGLIPGLIAGISVNAVAGFGEELGWRGLLQKELGFLGFWRSSAIIGLIWGIWHAPLILQGHNYPQHRFTGVFMMTVWCMLLSPIFSYVRLKAKSVIAAAIIHGSLNGTYGLSLIAIKGGSDLTVGATGLAGFIVLAVVNIALLSYDRVLAAEPIKAG